jgi:hypothetical protein
VAVSPVLTHQVRGPPQITQRSARETERAQPRGDAPAGPRRRVGRPPQQIGDPAQALGLLAENPLQHRGRALQPSLEDRLAVGDLPPGGNGPHDNLRVEAAEGGSHDLSRHVAHARAPTGEVRLQLWPGDAVLTHDLSGIEPECPVRRTRLRGEVHSRRHRLHRVAQPARSLPELGRHDRSPSSCLPECNGTRTEEAPHHADRVNLPFLVAVLGPVDSTVVWSSRWAPGGHPLRMRRGLGAVRDHDCEDTKDAVAVARREGRWRDGDPAEGGV